MQSRFKFKSDGLYPGIHVTTKQPPGGYILSSLTRKARHLIREMNRLDESWWQLFSLAVDKSERGKGYGGLLLGDAIQRSKAMNASMILQAQPYQGEPGLKQDDLVSFYKKHGFIIIPQPMNSYWLMWDIKDH